jgi:arsenate reductase (thioredoxin)
VRGASSRSTVIHLHISIEVTVVNGYASGRCIDIGDRRPQPLTRELAERADVVVTMGCGDECPYIPGKRYIDWDLPDPAGRPLDEVRATRDQIAGLTEALVAELDTA